MLYCRESERLGALALDEYQRKARQSDQNPRSGPDGLRVPLLGLFGEMGSLLTIPKRQQRETSTYYRHALIEEFGDVLWYLSNLASRHRIALSALARAKGEGNLLRVVSKTTPSLTFHALQRGPAGIFRRTAKVLESDSFALGGAVGRLMSEFAAGEHWELDRGEFLRHLARAFRLLVRAANNSGVSLNFAAQNNLAKIKSRWPKIRVFLRPFDADEESYEQLPRRVEMYFDEKSINGKTYVYQSCNDINIGDRLTDNRVEQDDYRFHDVFHLAYLAILGWSPVMRALFRVKRKSKPSFDENQDGARAILIEEGIATWIFNHGQDHYNFRYVKRLDYSLLKAVRRLVEGYEVERCPLWQWQMAILEGFRVFRTLKRRRRGWIVADLRHRSIEFFETRPL
jgi:NTP pyrophosphatase (non-canonical NTP hydrolase)